MARQSFALFGSPIDDSPSPAMQNAAFAALGIDAGFELRPADAGEADRVVAETRRELRGANVTTPLKTEVAAQVRLVGGASRAGAVNTLWWRGEELAGSLTDIEGVQVPLADTGYRGGGAALIIGAGGAARAAAVALAEIGAEVQIAARQPICGQAILDNLSSAHRGQALALSDHDTMAALFERLAVVIQATPVGRAGDQHALPWERATPTLVAFEMVTVPRRTPFIIAAAGRGLRTIEGWQMLVAQGAESFRLWTGKAAPVDVMTRAVWGVVGP